MAADFLERRLAAAPPAGRVVPPAFRLRTSANPRQRRAAERRRQSGPRHRAPRAQQAGNFMSGWTQISYSRFDVCATRPGYAVFVTLTLLGIGANVVAAVASWTVLPRSLPLP